MDQAASSEAALGESSGRHAPQNFVGFGKAVVLLFFRKDYGSVHAHVEDPAGRWDQSGHFDVVLVTVQNLPYHTGSMGQEASSSAVLDFHLHSRVISSQQRLSYMMQLIAIVMKRGGGVKRGQWGIRVLAADASDNRPVGSRAQSSPKLTTKKTMMVSPNTMRKARDRRRWNTSVPSTALSASMIGVSTIQGVPVTGKRCWVWQEAAAAPILVQLALTGMYHIVIIAAMTPTADASIIQSTEV